MRLIRKNRFAYIICLSVLLALSFSKNVYSKDTNTIWQIKQTEEDIKVFPDKYNTKPREPQKGFKIIESGSTFTIKNQEGQEEIIRLQETKNESTGIIEDKINLKYANANITGTIVFENIDFTATMDKFTMLSESGRTETKIPVKFVFNNCKFKSFSCGREGQDYVKYEFENCSFENFFGSNSIFKRCYFGGGIGDRIIPFCNDTFKDCYIANPTSQYCAEGEIHVDGTQIYGWSTTEAYQLHFDGCRFEVPAIAYPNAPKTYVNACIMLQLEFNNAHDLSFTDCYVNGGGYAVYAHSKYDEQTFKNTYFKNLKFGCCLKWGKLYPHRAPEIELNLDTWTDIQNIYVGTVIRDKKAKTTSISVTNDTNQKRKFKIFTSSGKVYDFEIDKCPLWKEIGDKKFEDFPFDKLYTIPEYCDWIVCFDTTNSDMKQVRYINWGDATVIAEKNNKGKLDVYDKDKYSVKSVLLQKKKYIYNGKNHKPKVVVKDVNGNIVSKSNYKVTYTNNKNVGQATAVIQMKGKYKGKYTRKYVINPLGTKIKKVTKKSASDKKTKNTYLTFIYKASKKQTSGYEIQISSDKKFYKKTKKVVINSNKINKKSIKIKAYNKNYYIRIRTFKKINTSGKVKKLYSTWSEKRMINAKI